MENFRYGTDGFVPSRSFEVIGMDSKKKGFVAGLASIAAVAVAIVGEAQITSFGFDASAWYAIASVQIVSMLVAVSFLYSTDRDGKRDD